MIRVHSIAARLLSCGSRLPVSIGTQEGCQNVLAHSAENLRIQPARQMSFLKSAEANELWKSMQGVSAQGRKRGRARRLMKPKDLSKGKFVSDGLSNMIRHLEIMSNLSNKPTVGAGASVQRQTMGEISEDVYDKYLQDLTETRNMMGTRRGFQGFKNPLERGWTGGKPGGRHYGAPVSLNKDLKFENFDSILLEFKTLFRMTGELGRVRRTSILMVTGNRNGTFGWTLSAGKYGKNKDAMRKAVNKAGLRLVTVDRFEDRTVYHDFFSRFGETRVLVHQRPPGTGVTAHRAIRAICELAGIKDLYAKVEGSGNILKVTKAFVLGLLRQKTHQTLADEKQLHLVQMRPENDFFPTVLASPSDGYVRSKKEIGLNESLDFQLISFEGQLPYGKSNRFTGSRSRWEGTGGWQKYIRRNWVNKAAPKVRTRMRVERGEEWSAVRSHLYEKYPECVEVNWKEVIAKLKAKKQGEAS